MASDLGGETDRHDLSRFTLAQVESYHLALSELRAGSKRSHWMWFIFPQLDGLGFSPTSRLYGIRGLHEASAYLRDTVLGPRLLECCEAVMAIDGRSAAEILGSPDDMKLRSCATLFAQVAEPGSVFERVLGKYFNGVRDLRTLQLIDAPACLQLGRSYAQ